MRHICADREMPPEPGSWPDGYFEDEDEYARRHAEWKEAVEDLYVRAEPDSGLANVYDERVGFWRQQLRCPRCRHVFDSVCGTEIPEAVHRRAYQAR